MPKKQLELYSEDIYQRINLKMICFVKKSFCLFLILGFHIDGFAQPDPFGFYDKNTTLPTSPEAALMERFGDIPISYYTGTADISIPLYTIKEAGLEIPIVLRYHSSGIKVQDQASWVGLGWSLEPGGMIVQSVMGEEDRSDNLVASNEEGYFNLKGRTVSGIYSTTNEIGQKKWIDAIPSLHCVDPPTPHDDPYITLYNLEKGMGQPDIYHYNFAGYSGKFYINPETGKVVMIDKKEDIVFSQETNYPSWEAITMDGHIFHFSDLEESSSYVVTENKGYTWKVTKIALNNGKEINFNYLDGHYTWPIYNETWTNNTYFGINAYFRYNDITQHNTKTLSRIETSEVVIEFNLEDRDDINMELGDDVKRLKSIDIKSVASGNDIKSFNFSYSYFPYSSVGGSFVSAIKEAYGKRLKLDAIQEVGYTKSGAAIISKPPYQFEYNTHTTLPLKTSFSQDFYGYYNGASNDKLIPDLTYFYNASKINHRFEGREFPEPQQLTYLVGIGANRIPDTTYATAGMLNKIIYPTGGRTEFDYEPHSFDNYFYPNKQTVAMSSKNFRVEDTNVASDKVSEDFTLNKTTKVRLSSYINNGLNDPPIQYNQLPHESAYIKFEKVKIHNGIPLPTLIKQWDLRSVLNGDFIENGGKRWEEEVFEVQYDPDPTVYYRVSVAFPDDLGPQNHTNKLGAVGCIVNYVDDTEIGNVSYQGGVRIKSIRNYSENGKMLGNKSIRYLDEDGSTSGKLMSPLALHYSRRMWHTEFSAPDHYVNDLVYDFLSSEASTASNHIGYTRVEVISLDEENSFNGKHVYKYINESNQFMTNLPDITNLGNGTLEGEQIFDVNGNLLEETTYFYKNMLTEFMSFTGIKIYSNFTGSVDPCAPAGSIMEGYCEIYPQHKYNIMFYPIISQWNVLDKKTSKSYMDGIALETEEKFYYNQKGQVIKRVFDDKQGNLVATHTTYPIDVTGNDSQERREQAELLKSVNLHNNILNQRQLFNDKKTNELKLFYRRENGLLKAENIVQREIQQSHDAQQFFTKVYFERYGPNKSLRQFIEKGITTSMLWDDTNANLIAAVKNAAVDDIAYSSFENNERGNLTYNIVNINPVHGRIGQRSYLLNNSIPIGKSNLKTNKTYIVSYWTDNAPFLVAGTVNYAIKGVTIGGWTYYEHKVTGQDNISINGAGHIDELRIYPIEGEMTTYTHDPLLGMTSQTDPNGNTVFYEYDEFGRLEAIKDQDGNVMEHLKYNYHVK